MRRRQKQILAFFVSLAMLGSATIPAYAEQENLASETIVKETTETKSGEAISEDSVGSLEKKEGEAEGKEVQVPEEKKQVSEGKVQEEKGKEEAENKENSRKGVENEVKEKEVAEGSVAKEENTYSIVDLSKLKSGFKETEEEGIEEAPVAETASLFGYSGFRSVGYVPRTTNPGTGGRFYGYDNPFPEPGWNCTWYAFGRAYEILGYKPNFYGNARDWWGNNQRTKTFPTGSEPRPGAIACWWGNSVYIYGHVAVVEKVENGVVYTSSSSYGTAGKGSRWSYSFRYDRMENVPGFQGYIYLYNQPTPPPKPDHLLMAGMVRAGKMFSLEIITLGEIRLIIGIWKDRRRMIASLFALRGERF